MSIELRGFIAGLAAALVALGGAFGTAAVVRSLLPTGHSTASPSSLPTAPANSSLGVVVATGQRFYQQSCASCHGSHGEGLDGPSLQGTKLTDAQLSSSIKGGYPNAMPAFGAKYNDADIKAITGYIRTLK